MVSLVKLIEDMLVDGLVEDINLCGSELASADTLLEQDTEFGKGSTIGLGEAEVSVDDAEEADTTLERVSLCWRMESLRGTYPEETGVIAPIPGSGVEHVWSQHGVDDTYDTTKVC